MTPSGLVDRLQEDTGATAAAIGTANGTASSNIDSGAQVLMETWKMIGHTVDDFVRGG